MLGCGGRCREVLGECGKVCGGGVAKCWGRCGGYGKILGEVWESALQCWEGKGEMWEEM